VLIEKDLVGEPFTKINPDGILGLFKQREIEEILKFCRTISRVINVITDQLNRKSISSGTNSGAEVSAILSLPLSR